MPINVHDKGDVHLHSGNAGPGEIISMDPVGPISPATSNNNHQWV